MSGLAIPQEVSKFENLCEIHIRSNLSQSCDDCCEYAPLFPVFGKDGEKRMVCSECIDHGIDYDGDIVSKIYYHKCQRCSVLIDDGYLIKTDKCPSCGFSHGIKIIRY